MKPVPGGAAKPVRGGGKKIIDGLRLSLATLKPVPMQGTRV